MSSLNLTCLFVFVPAALRTGPEVDSTTNGYEYQESSFGGGGGAKRGRRVMLTTPPSVSYYLQNVQFSTSHNPMGLHVLLQA
jgi:hypothetical protein